MASTAWPCRRARKAWWYSGSAYVPERLADITWLARCRLWYWGDIDTHGFRRSQPAAPDAAAGLAARRWIARDAAGTPASVGRRAAGAPISGSDPTDSPRKNSNCTKTCATTGSANASALSRSAHRLWLRGTGSTASCRGPAFVRSGWRHLVPGHHRWRNPTLPVRRQPANGSCGTPP
ncbi:MAG: DUF2220 family protein [Gammaproteobacteria bacterium]|nr:DUF2220 family protein [Gammaproteobacteria bacterium]